MTESASARPVLVNPPLYKQALVGILVGGTLGPTVGWFIGTFATIYTVFLSDNLQNGAVSARGMRGSAFLGGLLGILLGLVTGPLVGLPMRIAASTIIKSLTNFWVGATVGAAVGLGIGYLIHLYWDPSAEAFVYLIIHSIFVGGAVGGLAVIAKPKWLSSD